MRHPGRASRVAVGAGYNSLDRACRSTGSRSFRARRASGLRSAHQGRRDARKGRRASVRSRRHDHACFAMAKQQSAAQTPRRLVLVQLRHLAGYAASACLSVQGPPVKCGSDCPWLLGGEWLRVVRRFGSSCARAPRLISVRDHEKVGDMMVMGCVSRWGKRCGRSVFLGRPPVGVGSRLPGAGRGASV